MKHLLYLLRRKGATSFSDNTIRFFVIVLLTGIMPVYLHAQSILDKTISIDVKAQPLHDVLEIISNQGNFYFSYNSNIVRRDSLVTLSASNKTVRQVLDILFKGSYLYMVSGNYIILRRAPLQLPLITSKAGTNENMYEISGYVLNEETGERIGNASVYEKQRLASTLTDGKGYFKIKLKSRYHTAAITVSKEFYEDTTIVVQSRYNQQVNILITPLSIDGVPVTIAPAGYKAPDSIVMVVPNDNYIDRYIYHRTDSIRVERTALGRMFLSSRQKIQSINLRKFFAKRNYQMSLTPGLSTQGKLSSQVINRFSFNVIGGYTGGVHGVEIGGAFNINRKSARYLQVAGLTNVVGGTFEGLQVSGVSNTVLDSAKGFQVTGITNVVKGDFTGWQFSGMFNHIVGDGKGVQVAGIANVAIENMKGLQMSGHINVARKEMNGVQVSGLLNYAKKLKGVQIGFINIADTSEGYSIGLINIIVKGYHKLSISANELTPVNAAFRTGNHKLYSILLAGFTPGSSSKVFTFGYGIGREMMLGKHFFLNPELTTENVYLGNWEELRELNKLHLNFQWRAGKYLSFFAGPSFAAYYDARNNPEPGFKTAIPSAGYNTFSLWNKNWTGWIGWNVGVNIF